MATFIAKNDSVSVYRLKKTLNILVFPSGAEMKQTPALNIFDIRAPPGQGPVRRRELPKDKYNNSIPVKTLWGFLDEYIITGKLSRMISIRTYRRECSLQIESLCSTEIVYET